MANIPNQSANVGSTLPNGPTIESGMVQERGVQSKPVQTPDLALGGMDKAFANFFGGLEAASGAASGAALEQRNADQMSTLDATKIADAKQDEKYKQQGEADAASGKAADPAANQFREYQQTYATYKGNNAGVVAAQDFAHNVLPTLGANSNFDDAVTTYVKGNHFDTGDPAYDAAAANAFRSRVLGLRQGFQGDQVKATIQDGVQAMSSTIGQKTADSTLTSDDLQTGIASYKKLNPLDAANAGPKVMQAAMGAAKTVPQMTNLLARLNEPNSFAPGVSYAQQFPDKYAEMNERFARQSAETTTLAGSQAYEGLEQRLETARVNNDSGALGQIMADNDAVMSQYGGSARHDAIFRQVAPILKSMATQTATYNTLDQGVGNPAVRDPKLFTEKGDAYFKARGIDPLNAASPKPAVLSGTEAAARTVVAYNAIPSDTKQKMSLALNNGSAPDQQATAYSFYHTIAGSVGEANVLQLMNPEAQQTYQTVRDLTAGGANIQGVLTSLANNGKSELKDIPETTVTGQADPAAAKVALGAAVDKAINDGMNVNGSLLGNAYRVTNFETPAIAATISPEVRSRITSQIMTGARVTANMGPLDVSVLAKQAVERETPNIITLPGSDGRPIVAYVPNMPTSVPDPANPGRQVPVVPMGRNVLNPDTKQFEDTTATAQADLHSLGQVMPDRFGAGNGLSLAVAAGSYANDLTKATGVYTVMEGGMGGSPGQPVMFDGTHPIMIRNPSAVAAAQSKEVAPFEAGIPQLAEDMSDRTPITLGSDPVAAAAKLKDLMPNTPFVLVRSTTPQGPVYTLGYKPRFTTSLPTVDQRQAAFQGSTAAQSFSGLPGVDDATAVPASTSAR